jgi:hypothetical protein
MVAVETLREPSQKVLLTLGSREGVAESYIRI